MNVRCGGWTTCAAGARPCWRWTANRSSTTGGPARGPDPTSPAPARGGRRAPRRGGPPLVRRRDLSRVAHRAADGLGARARGRPRRGHRRPCRRRDLLGGRQGQRPLPPAGRADHGPGQGVARATRRSRRTARSSSGPWWATATSPAGAGGAPTTSRTCWPSGIPTCWWARCAGGWCGCATVPWRPGTSRRREFYRGR